MEMELCHGGGEEVQNSSIVSKIVLLHRSVRTGSHTILKFRKVKL